jgi:hypothetical protein
LISSLLFMSNFIFGCRFVKFVLHLMKLFRKEKEKVHQKLCAE